eukprot:scaffold239494_cov47-Prasinocladus_malaysianus.AAC.2
MAPSSGDCRPMVCMGHCIMGSPHSTSRMADLQEVSLLVNSIDIVWMPAALALIWRHAITSATLWLVSDTILDIRWQYNGVMVRASKAAMLSCRGFA